MFVISVPYLYLVTGIPTSHLQYGPSTVVQSPGILPTPSSWSEAARSAGLGVLEHCFTCLGIYLLGHLPDSFWVPLLLCAEEAKMPQLWNSFT